MFNFSQSKQKDATLLIDITEDGLSALVVKEDGGKPMVLALAERDFLPHQKEKESYFSAMLEALESALTELAPSLSVSKTVFFLPPSLYATDFLKIKEERSKPFAVTPSLVGTLIERAVAQKGSFVTKEGQGKALPIEKRLTHITLNGYCLSSPYGKKTPQMEISLFLAVSSEEYLEKLKSLLSRYTSHNHVLFFARPVAFAASLYHHVYTNPGTFLLFIAEKSTSTLVSIEEGHLVDALAIPFGKETIIERSAKGLGVLPAELEEGLTAQEKRSARDTALWHKKIRLETKSLLIPFFETVADKSFLSKNLCVVGKNAEVIFWQNIFKEEDFWTGTDLFRGITQKENILPELFIPAENDQVLRTGTVPLSTSLILGTLFLTTVGEV